MQEMIDELREGLDELSRDMNDTTDPEFYKINTVRFVERYRIMRAMERRMEKEQS